MDATPPNNSCKIDFDLQDIEDDVLVLEEIALSGGGDDDELLIDESEKIVDG